MKGVALCIAIVILTTIAIGEPHDLTNVTNTAELHTLAIPSAIVWSDNFDDEDISDWQLFAVDPDLPEPLLPGNSTAEGGVLRHIGVE
jgi:hypothetical protein